MMPTIFLALAQYSHFSNVLRGQLLRALAGRFRVVVLTPVIDDGLAARDGYFTAPGVSYQKFALTQARLWALSDGYLRVPFVRSLDHLAYMHHFYRRDHWWPRKLLMCSRLLFPRTLFTTDRITAWEMRRAKVPPAFSELVRHERPRLLATATPGFTPFEAEMIIAAKRLGITTAAVDINYDNLTSNGKLIRKTDYLAVWNDGMRREAEELHGYPPARIRIVGCLRFDHYFTDRQDPRFPSREAFLRQKGLDPGRKTVVFVGPTPSNYPPRAQFVRELIRLRREGRIAGDPNILVRIHPNDALTNYGELTGEPRFRIERAGRKTKPDTAGGQKVEMGEEELINLTATLAHADVVLNFASTLVIEACLFDRPVINIAFPAWRRIVYEYEYNKGLVDTGAVRLAESPEALAALVNRYLADPALERASRRKLIEAYVPFRDGKAGERTAEYLWQLAHEAHSP